MSYYKRVVPKLKPGVVYARRAMSGDTAHGPSWYTAMGGIQSRPTGRRVVRGLGSLGDDAPQPTTLSTPTIPDPLDAATRQWQADVLASVKDGARTLKTEEMQRWFQIIATLAIPVSAAIWRAIFRNASTSV